MTAEGKRGGAEAADKSSPESPQNAELLSLDALAARRDRKTKRVYVEKLGFEIVVRKLPASILERKDIDDLSPMVLALTEGVAEPEITEALIEELTFEEANAIYEAVEGFNPNIISVGDSEGEDSASRRKAFPS